LIRAGHDFLWGVATAAYQIEGAAYEGGRGESIWDRFCALPGKVLNGDDGSVACDFYHRWPSDLGLLRELGATGFRFSISWPRVLPTGRGEVNEPGLDFYDRLVDGLLESGIEPMVTLYHWDLPTVLEDEGGWPARGTVHAFVQFAEVVAGRLGDRVTHWITHNEPWVVAWVGYGWGEHAPGRTSPADAIAAAHHLLLSHGLACQAIRAASPGARLGIALNLTDAVPASEKPEDAAAAAELDGEQNRWFLDPLFRGEYPADVKERLAPLAPPVLEGDLRTIPAPLDFLGVNYYTRTVVERTPDLGRRAVPQPRAPQTEMGWEIAPQSLHRVLVRLHRDYAPAAIAVTENGAAFADVRAPDGSVRDPERQAYLAEHVEAVRRALEDGVPISGYFVWSLLDNFEWSFGYSKRFGIVYVDYATLERTPKSSFYWYRDLIATRR
jgi:beta-glucosidase